MGMPDADIYPSATGLASHVVKAHENAQAEHVLYSGWFCPFVQRAWIVLEEKKIPYRYKEINPYHKEPSFLALNPRGLVPTLGCPTPSGEEPLIESNIICDYLDDTFPDKAPLYPSDAYTKAKLRVSIDFVTSRIIPAYHRFLQHTPDKAYSLEDARKEFLGHLLTWIKDADPTGPYFAGKEFGMGDVVMAPWALRLWVFDHFKEGGLGMPEEGKGGEDEELWGRWRVWADAVSKRESVKGTMSEREHYLPLYQRYADDTAQSEMAKASRGGRGVP
ncbi:Glutathione S-transferase omega-1 [Cyphellophora attinorum]|uniref:Glutathione S-transferase omega-1 n=1 Tax=Cyphellophora attinorum TaxID=1664694 RepID=A0A0N1P2Y8_9EURO|nr:Glutathione S-transferase omega-1 [Phialophora attinorum]KPI44254.1 Glutathione S-transferase omega-1 [Phialophora attinorum]